MVKKYIEPLNDKIVIKRDPSINEFNGFKITGSTPPDTGNVIAVGPQTKVVKVGDNVIFPKMTGVDVKLDEEDFLILTQEQLIGIIKE